MGRVLNSALAATLAVGALSGCGEQGYEQQAEVVGFARGIDGQIIEAQWLLHQDEPMRPGGNVRNLRRTEKFVGCHEVEDSDWSIFNLSDSECWGFGDGCSEGENTHCEADYDDRFSYERLEDVVIQECPSPLVALEVKPSVPVKDEACIAQAIPPKRFRPMDRFVIWVRAFNKNHDPNNPKSGPAIYESQRDVNAKEWQKIDRGTQARVTVTAGRITAITFKI